MAGPGVRSTQEVLETVVSPLPRVRGTQEVLEVVQPFTPGPEPVTGAWLVEASPQVYWTAEVPVNAWTVHCTPRIEYLAAAVDPTNRFFVECRPKVSYVTGPGTASTECISGDGVVPPPAEEPPESLEQNYVF